MRTEFKIRMMIVIAAAVSFAACRNKADISSEVAPEPKNGPTSVTMSQAAIGIAGIKIQVAELRSVPLLISAPGEITLNPRKVHHVTSRLPGRIEEVFAFIGDRVSKGRPLLTLFSPEFLSAQAEFLQARARLVGLDEALAPEDAKAARAIADSARTRLLILGLAEEEIKAIEESRAARNLLTVSTPLAGTVIESAAVAGDTLEAGADLFRIADLSSLLVNARIHEKDLGSVAAGVAAVVKVGAYPNLEFKGKLAQLSDLIDIETRTVIGRVEVGNDAARLKPGMFADVTLIIPSRTSSLLIPESAVQRIGGKTVVFVPAGERSFALKEIAAGSARDGWIEILSGLAPGESFVATGGFFIKSELLKESLEGE
jgi:RND family efflux transporter MFP subunit